MRPVRTLTFGTLTSIVLSGSAFAQPLVERGRSIVMEHCGRCHAVENEPSSSHTQAPSFRDVVKRYPPAEMEESLAEGIVSGHPDMPEFTFAASEIDAIIAYLDDLATR